MNKNLCAVLALSPILLFSGQSQAEGKFVLGASAGIRAVENSLDLDLAPYGGNGPSKYGYSAEGTLPYIGLNTGYVYGGFYLSLGIEAAPGISADSSGAIIEEGGGVTPLDNGNSSADLTSNHINLSLGYKLNDSWTVFFGHKSGNTDVETEEDFSFHERGKFLGVAYRYPFKSSAITFSTAYAALNYRVDMTPQSNQDDSSEDRITGDATGLSLSVTWSSRLTASTNYFVSGKYQKYDYDVDGNITMDLAGTKTEGVGTAETSVMGVAIGINYIF